MASHRLNSERKTNSPDFHEANDGSCSACSALLLLCVCISNPGTSPFPAHPSPAEAILQAGDADLVAIARQALHDPHSPLHAAKELGCDDHYDLWPREYGWWLNKREANFPSP